MKFLNCYFYVALMSMIIGVPKCTAEVLSSCTCGQSNAPFKSRIVGGTVASKHEYPWMALIITSTGSVYCGGSIVSTRHILSAGHCPFHDPGPSPISPNRYILVGLHEVGDEDGVKYDIERVYMHPDWKAFKNHDVQDMAIYETAKPIEFTDNILPICLPTTPKKYEDVNALVAGWGLTLENGAASDVLQEAKLKVMSEADCEKDEKIGKIYTADSMLCAYAPNKDACQGDSGGPLFMDTDYNRFEQIGVVSFGYGCNTGIPAIYTKVSTSLDWIHSIIDSADTCQDPELTSGESDNDDNNDANNNGGNEESFNEFQSFHNSKFSTFVQGRV